MDDALINKKYYQHRRLVVIMFLAGLALYVLARMQYEAAYPSTMFGVFGRLFGFREGYGFWVSNQITGFILMGVAVIFGLKVIFSELRFFLWTDRSWKERIGGILVVLAVVLLLQTIYAYNIYQLQFYGLRGKFVLFKYGLAFLLFFSGMKLRKKALPPPYVEERVSPASQGFFADGIDIEEAGMFEQKGLWIGSGVHHAGEGHAVTCASPGSGKGACIIIPNLLFNNPPVPHSWVVLDPKGTNAAITARYQKESGQDVILLDPWNVQKALKATHGIETKGFNPFDFIKMHDPSEIPDICDLVAEMLIPDNPFSKDPIWDQSARSALKTYMLHLLSDAYRPEEQNFGKLYELVRLPGKERFKLWEQMKKNTAFNGIVAHKVGELQQFPEDSDTLASIFFTIHVATNLFESQALRASLSQSDFHPYDLTKGGKTVYIILPDRHIDKYGRWMRLLIGICLRACNARPDKFVYYMLDEFATLGRMNNIMRDFGFAREQKIRLWIFIQSLPQLVNLYGEAGKEVLIGTAAVRQFFGVNDLTTARYVSELLGEVKHWKPTQSDNKGWSVNEQGEASQSGNSGTSYSEEYKRLLRPEEVMQTDKLITLANGLKLALNRWPYYEPPTEAHGFDDGPYDPADDKCYYNVMKPRADENPNYRANSGTD